MKHPEETTAKQAGELLCQGEFRDSGLVLSMAGNVLRKPLAVETLTCVLLPVSSVKLASPRKQMSDEGLESWMDI